MNWYKQYLYAWTAKATYTLDELLHKLKLFGVIYYKSGKGDHDIYINTHNNKTTAVPVGARGRTIASNTLTNKMLPELGIPWNVWSSLGKRPKKKDVARIQHLLPWNQEQIIEQIIEQKSEQKSEQKIPDWQKDQWYIDQQQQQSQKQYASANNWYENIKISQNIPISIVSYNPQTAELGISFNDNQKYVYPKVSPFVYNKIETLLRVKNYRKVQEMLKNLSANKPETQENRNKMLSEIPSQKELWGWE